MAETGGTLIEAKEVREQGFQTNGFSVEGSMVYYFRLTVAIIRPDSLRLG